MSEFESTRIQFAKNLKLTEFGKCQNLKVSKYVIFKMKTGKSQNLKVSELKFPK